MKWKNTKAIVNYKVREIFPQNQRERKKQTKNRTFIKYLIILHDWKWISSTMSTTCSKLEWSMNDKKKIITINSNCRRSKLFIHMIYENRVKTGPSGSWTQNMYFNLISFRFQSRRWTKNDPNPGHKCCPILKCNLLRKKNIIHTVHY